MDYSAGVLPLSYNSVSSLYKWVGVVGESFNSIASEFLAVVFIKSSTVIGPRSEEFDSCIINNNPIIHHGRATYRVGRIAHSTFLIQVSKLQQGTKILWLQSHDIHGPLAKPSSRNLMWSTNQSWC